MKEFIKKFYSSNFVYNGKEKLSKLTVTFIAILNVFIFITLGLGIDYQVKVLTLPSITFPYECREIINSRNIDDFNEYFYSNENYEEINKLEIDSRCNNILINKINDIKIEHDIKLLRSNQNELIKNENKINDELNYIKDNYNTVLFEKLSSQTIEKSIVKDNLSSINIKEKFTLYENQLEEIKIEKEKLYSKFKDSQSVQKLLLYSDEHKEQINIDIVELNKEYELKTQLVTLAFLLPLVFTFFYLMKRYLIKEKYILYIMFKNILVVTLIPTFISLLTLIYTLLPKIFIHAVVEFFYNIEIPFVVYYFAITIFIIIFGFTIIKLQKRFKEQNNKFKNNTITKIESFNSNTCNNCGNRVDYIRMDFCPSCKNQLRIKCNSCNDNTIKGLNYCYSCGDSIKE